LGEDHKATHQVAACTTFCNAAVGVQIIQTWMMNKKHSRARITQSPTKVVHALFPETQQLLQKVYDK